MPSPTADNSRGFPREWLVLLAAAIVFGLPGLFLLDARTTFDGHAHLRYLEYFAEAFRQGQFYPRWASGMYAGCGDAAFFFYPPLSYYLALPFYLLSNSANLSFAAAVILITYLSGVFMYRYLCEIAPSRHALIATVLYLFLPTRSISYYVAGSPSELMGYTAIPLILLAVRRIFRGEYHYTLLLALAMAFTFLSSVSMAVMFGLMLLPAFTLYEWVEAGRPRRALSSIMLSFAGAGLGAVLLSTALLWPMLREFSHVALSRADRAYINPPNATATLLALPNTSQLILLWFALMAVGFLLIELFRHRKMLQPEYHARLMFVLWLSVVLVFLMSPFSIMLWSIPSFARIFAYSPIRTYCCFALPWAVVVALYSISFAESAGRTLKVTLLLFIALIFLISPALFPKGRHNILDIWEYSSRNFHEFMPTQAEIRRWPNNDMEVLERSAVACGEKTQLLSGDARIEVESWKPYEVTLKTDSSSASSIRLGLFHYPYWNITEGTADISTEPVTGQMLLEIPPGAQTIRLAFLHPSYIRIANSISILSLLGMLLLLWCWRKRFLR